MRTPPLSGIPLPFHTLEILEGSTASGFQQPALFIGHGNPMYALADNQFTNALRGIATTLPETPKAILVVSAHWQTRGTKVMTNPKPETVHDFYGFPQALFEIEYPAPGAPELAQETTKLLASRNGHADPVRGFDHGTWAILRHMFPAADIPVFQISLDVAASWENHFQTGKLLQSLRKNGVLVIGSGNIVHNLAQADFRNPQRQYEWAEEFDTWAMERIRARAWKDLLNPEHAGAAFRLAVPTDEHYLPLLYTLALAEKQDEISVPYAGIEHGSISMRCLRIG